MLTPRNVVPSGLPRCCSAWFVLPLEPCRDVLRRKSCVIAMPMDAKANDVRSQARNVRSARNQYTMSINVSWWAKLSPSARWSLATLPLFSSSTDWKYRRKLRNLLSSGLSLLVEAVVLTLPPAALAPVGCSRWVVDFWGPRVFLCRASVSGWRVW